MTKDKKKNVHEKEIKYLHDEILRRDKIIEELKRQNEILVKTSIKKELELVQDKER